ncbi:MAG: RNA-binding cell elongation regulator Jag/EloR [Actinomycetota bacterium]
MPPTGAGVVGGSDNVVEWVEVRGKSVDVAIAAAMSELGMADRDAVDIEVVQEPEKGFLGIGGRDAIVRVKPRAASRNRRRRGRDRSDTGNRSDRPGGRDLSGSRGGGGGRSQGESGRATGRPTSRGPGRGGGRPVRSPSASRQDRSGNNPRSSGSGGVDRAPAGQRPRFEGRPRLDVDAHQQAPAVEAFLVGLLEAFGLEGTVEVTVEEDVVVAGISGEQTEALVGPRGSLMEAIHEITKTALHRQYGDTARVRLDIAGYADRRRQALSIYAQQLIEQVLNEGGEIMLEPMSAADRKVIHDAVAGRQGVQSYSEGEPPRRYVVIATTGEDQAADAPLAREAVTEPDE